MRWSRRSKLWLGLAAIALALVSAATVVIPLAYLSSSKPVRELTLEAKKKYELHTSYTPKTSPDNP